jgi:dTDP-4-dehydrorhamnose reductase
MKILVLGGTSSIALDFLKLASNDKSLEIYGTFCEHETKTADVKIKWIKLCLSSDAADFRSSVIGVNFDYAINFIVLKSNNNLILHYKVLEDAINRVCNNATKFINVSSNAVYAQSKNMKLENDNLDLHNNYSFQKIMSEELFKHKQLNLRASILPVNGFGSGTLVKNIYKAEEGSKIFVNKDNYWNGVLSTHFAEILYTIISNNLFVYGARNIFSLKPEPTLELIRAIKKFTGRQDLIIEIKNDEPLNSTILNTIHEEFHADLWANSVYRKEISASSVLDELSKLRFHLQ